MTLVDLKTLCYIFTFYCIRRPKFPSIVSSIASTMNLWFICSEANWFWSNQCWKLREYGKYYKILLLSKINPWCHIDLIFMGHFDFHGNSYFALEIDSCTRTTYKKRCIWITFSTFSTCRRSYKVSSLTISLTFVLEKNQKWVKWSTCLAKTKKRKFT